MEIFEQILLGFYHMRSVIGVSLIYYISLEAFKNLHDYISLKKESPYNEKIIRVLDTTHIKEKINKEKISETVSKETKKLLEPYVLKLLHHMDSEDILYLRRNLKTIQVDKNLSLNLYHLAGLYAAKVNKIIFMRKYAIGHELLHMASAYYLKETEMYFAGFMQSNLGLEIGRALNEGCTELLNSRIFQNGEVKSYSQEVRMARLFECFFNNPKDMEHLYFRADLKGFIDCLGKYADKKEVIRMLLNMDKYTNENRTAIFQVLKKIEYTKMEFTLYKWFMKKNKEKSKRQQFEQILSENPLTRFLIKHPNFVLNRYFNKKKEKEERTL